MWDKHRQIRQHSRKRAVRAARARVEGRGHAVHAEAPQRRPKPEPEPAEHQLSNAPAPADALPESQEAPGHDHEKTGASEHDPAGSLAWTGLILLTLVLGGFMGALMFMLG